jgi:hypothetical protein
MRTAPAAQAGRARPSKNARPGAFSVLPRRVPDDGAGAPASAMSAAVPVSKSAMLRLFFSKEKQRCSLFLHDCLY